MKRQVNDMERLTDKFDDGTVGLKEMLDSDSLIEIGTLVKDPYISARLVQAMELLHRYELTGFTPDEHEDLKICLDTEGNGKSGEDLLYDMLELLRYRQAEHQGLLHKAPVPDGTQVFIVHDEELAELLDEDYEQIKITNITYVYGLTEYSYGELGKGFFITREDAENYIKSLSTTDAP